MKQLNAVHANHRRIAKGVLLTAIFVAFAKLGVAGREVALAWRYGTSSIIDAFQLAFTITTWIPFLLAGVSTGLLVPRVVSTRRDPERHAQFIAELNGTVVAVALLTTTLTLLGYAAAVSVMGTGLGDEVKQLAKAFSLSLLPVTLLTVAAGYFIVRLQASEHHLFSITEVVPPLAVILLVVLLPHHLEAGPLIWGTVAGTLLQVVLLARMTNRHTGGIGALSFRHSSPEWRSIYRDMLILGAGQALITLTIPIDQAFAARLGEGAIATYGYAIRMLGLAIALGTLVAARALLPVLSEVAADADHALGRAQAIRWSFLLFFGGIAAAILGWLLAPLAVSLFFERGAFTAQDSEAVTRIIRYGMAQLPFSFGALAIIQWCAALRRYDAIMVAAGAALVVKVVFNLLLYEKMGLAGLALSTAAMYAASFLSILLSLKGISKRTASTSAAREADTH